MDRFEAMAKAVGDKLWGAGCLSELNATERRRKEAHIAAALRAAATVPEGYVRTGTTDHKLLGTLPMTADGCIIGTNADLYSWWVPQYTDDEGICQHSSTGPIVSAPHQCYSTREAAESARAAKGEGKKHG